MHKAQFPGQECLLMNLYNFMGDLDGKKITS